MVSPRPSWVSVRPSMMVWPPSSRMPTSNDTRVRVDGFSKIMASVLPPSGLSCPPLERAIFIALPRSRIWRSVLGSTWSRSRKCLGTAMTLLGGLVRTLAGGLERLRGLLEDGDALVECGLVGDQRREEADHVLARDRHQHAERQQAVDHLARRHLAAQALQEARAAPFGEHLGMLGDQRLQLALEVLAALVHAVDETRLQKHVEHGVGHAGGQRVAAVGRAMGARHHADGGLLGRHEGADREAAAHALATAMTSGATPDHS